MLRSMSAIETHCDLGVEDIKKLLLNMKQDFNTTSISSHQRGQLEKIDKVN